MSSSASTPARRKYSKYQVSHQFVQLVKLFPVTGHSLLVTVLGASRTLRSLGSGCYEAGIPKAVDDDRASCYFPGCCHHLDRQKNADLGLPLQLPVEQQLIYHTALVGALRSVDSPWSRGG